MDMGTRLARSQRAYRFCVLNVGRLLPMVTAGRWPGRQQRGFMSPVCALWHACSLFQLLCVGGKIGHDRGLIQKPGRVVTLYLAVCFGLAFAALFYPLYVIRPFRSQGVHELAAALFVLRIRWWVEILAVVMAALGLAWFWRRESRILRRAAAVAGTLVVCGIAWLTRVNVYEIMFHPDTHPSFSPASESKLDGAEKVIAVDLGGAARAYPIRIISYHHIINDTVGGIPIAATY